MNKGPSFFAELQRRHVYKVGAAYGVAGWLLVQIVTQVFPIFHISELAQRLMVLAVIAGLPVALVLAWVFDLTPQGIVRSDAESPLDAPARARARRSADRKLNYLLGALLLLAGGYFAALRLGMVAPPSAAPEGGAAGKSIAVLPFENLSDDKTNAYFADGIQDEILTKLAGIGALRVISRTSTEKYKSRPDNLRTVAEELGVGTVLEGSVQKAGDKVRVNVQLIDARADAHLWANTYDRNLKDVFAVESEVSQDIADALKARLSPAETTALAALPTRNAAAYDAFLKAEFEFAQAGDSWLKESFLAAEGDYRRALELDPAFALAHARLAHCLMVRHWFAERLSPAELDQVKAHAGRALELSPDLAAAHLALGLYHYWGYRRYDEARIEIEQAIRFAPSDGTALAILAAIQRRQAQWPQALENFEKAQRLSPRDSTVLTELGVTYCILRRYRDADAQLRRLLAIDPTNANAQDFLLLTRLFGFGDAAGARQAYEPPPGWRISPLNDLGGDIVNIVNRRTYPDFFERRYAQAMGDWDSAPAETEHERLSRRAALATIQFVTGQGDAARPDCQRLAAELQAEAAHEPASLSVLQQIAWVNLCLGRRAEALQAAQRAVDLLPIGKDAYFGVYLLVGQAQIETYAGAPDAALQRIAQLLAMPAGEVMSVERLKRDPIWDPLRSDPRFARLIADAEAPTKAAAQP